MTDFSLSQWPLARWAVLGFVLLNTIIFGFSDVWLLVAALVGAVIFFKNPIRWKSELPPASYSVGLCFAWVFFLKLASALWAVDPEQSLHNAFNHLHFLLWFFLLPIFKRSNTHPFDAERWIAISFILLFCFWILILVVNPGSEQGYRFGGGWGNPGMLANVLVYFLLWVFAALTRPAGKRSNFEFKLMWFAMLVGTLVLLGTKGRAEQIILCIGIAAISVWRIRYLISNYKSMYGVILISVTVAISIGFNLNRFLEVVPEVKSYMQGGNARHEVLGSSLGGRMEMYKMAIDAIMAKPLTGWGAGLKPSTVAQYATDPANPPPYRNFHNLYLQIPLEVGLIGAGLSLVLIIWVFFLTVFRHIRSAQPEVALLVVLLWAVYAIKSLLNATFGYPLPNGVFVFFTAWFWVCSDSFSAVGYKSDAHSLSR